MQIVNESLPIFLDSAVRAFLAAFQPYLTLQPPAGRRCRCYCYFNNCYWLALSSFVSFLSDETHSDIWVREAVFWVCHIDLTLRTL